MPNDIKHRILGNQEISGKSQNCTMLQPSALSSSQIQNSVYTSQKLLGKDYKLNFLPQCAVLHEFQSFSSNIFS